MNIHIFGHVCKQKEVAQLYIQVLAVSKDLNMQQHEDEQGKEHH